MLSCYQDVLESYYKIFVAVKGIVQPKNHLLTFKLFQSCMHFFFSVEHKRRYFEESM